MSNRNALDNISPATMITSIVGYIVGLAGMALLGIGSLFFVKILVDSVLVFIPSIVAEKNPWSDLSTIISINRIIYSLCAVAAGTALRKISGYLCSQDTLKTIESYFYRRNE